MPKTAIERFATSQSAASGETPTNGRYQRIKDFLDRPTARDRLTREMQMIDILGDAGTQIGRFVLPMNPVTSIRDQDGPIFDPPISRLVRQYVLDGKGVVAILFHLFFDVDNEGFADESLQRNLRKKRLSISGA